MEKRFVTIWFPHLKTDWFVIKNPALKSIPFVLASPDHGRMVITAANEIAIIAGANPGTVVADARALIPGLQVLDDQPELAGKLLKALGKWFIRFSPCVGVDPPEGLIIDATGCSHLWGGEAKYLSTIQERLKQLGYTIRIAIANTIGMAWAAAHFAHDRSIIEPGEQKTAMLSLPPAALRLEMDMLERFQKLGLYQLKDIVKMPASVLRRRFGDYFLQRVNQALGKEEEYFEPLVPFKIYQERLPCLEPIVTATGIEIAVQRLLELLCHRLQQEELGLRTAIFCCYRVDGKVEKIEIGTSRPSHNHFHLFKLFENHLGQIEPAMGIELFTLEAQKLEDAAPVQIKLWENTGGLEHSDLSELLDRIAGKIGSNNIKRYLPAEHYWPERSYKPTDSLQEKPATFWQTHKLRPIQLLPTPEKIEVTAPIPDYPPMLFRHKNEVHKIAKADGPERIEQEWWIEDGEHRDYYCVEDEKGQRFWLFRLGHYTGDKSHQWFLHGYFA
ncbi:MAG: DNA polymerase Y family protein [Bacteroidota bacterium]